MKMWVKEQFVLGVLLLAYIAEQAVALYAAGALDVWKCAPIGGAAVGILGGQKMRSMADRQREQNGLRRVPAAKMA